jgi:transcriptional regulator with XRE-family HTH domain
MVMLSPTKRLKLARERAGLSHEEAAEAAGIFDAAYWDLESHESDMEMAVSLENLQKLCEKLGITINDLFADEPVVPVDKISFAELVSKIKNHLAVNHQTISKFEEKVGFIISPSFEDPSSFLEWDIECLRSVCAEIGIDWLRALP